MTDKSCSIPEKVSVSGLEKFKFHQGQGIKENLVDNNVVLTHCVGNKFSQSVKISMLPGKMIATEVDDKLIPTFKIEEDKRCT